MILATGGLRGQTIPTIGGIGNADTNSGNGTDGDIILGFTEPTSAPTSTALNQTADLVVDIGPASDYYETGNGGTLTAGTAYTVSAFTPTDVTGFFGSSAFSSSAVLWGIIGGNGQTGGPGTEPLGTLWAATPGSQALQANSSTGSLSNTIDNLTSPLGIYAQEGGVGGTSAATPSGNGVYLPFSSGFYTAAGSEGNFGTFNASALGTLAGTSHMELYELIPPQNGTGAESINLGTFALSSSGLTFTAYQAIPEPSTYRRNPRRVGHRVCHGPPPVRAGGTGIHGVIAAL